MAGGLGLQHVALLEAPGDRAVVVIPLVDVDVDAVTALLSQPRAVAGLVLVLPPSDDITAAHAERLARLQHTLLHTTVRLRPPKSTQLTPKKHDAPPTND